MIVYYYNDEEVHFLSLRPNSKFAFRDKVYNNVNYSMITINYEKINALNPETTAKLFLLKNVVVISNERLDLIL